MSKDPKALQIPISKETIARLSAQSDKLRGIGERSDLPDEFLLVSFTEAAASMMSAEFLRDFYNAQRGLIVALAEEHGYSPKDMAMRLRLDSFEPSQQKTFN